MGCDIHAHAERTFDERWDADLIFHSGGELDIERWYELFGYLAGVRGENDPIVLPKGFPVRVSEETKESYDDWDSDAHTPTWITFKEMKKLPKKFKGEPFYKYMEALAKLHGESNIRMVFWFDN